VAHDSQDHTVVVHVTPGELLDGRWRIERRIGQGAMGSVFSGKDLETARRVAVKILAPEHCRKAKVVARFEREAEAMTSLRHPNIVQLLGHGRRGALPYIAMELLDGVNLAELLQRHAGRLGLQETIAILKQVGSALSFLHHHGLVHRDVKPHNVVINGKGRVTLLDLGVVRDRHNPGLTRPGTMVGTPYYMSPEQIAGRDDIDRRADVYALAAMTFELLTGRPPFMGQTNFEVLQGHKHAPPPDASVLVQSVPRSVAQVLVRGMAKRREDRPDSASELIADLEAAGGAQKVDLAKAFSSIGVDTERSRAVPRMEPGRRPTRDAAAERDSEDKTVVLRQLEPTHVGPMPRPSEGRTALLPALRCEPSEGTIEVQVSAGGKPVRATVVIDHTRHASPCSTSVAPGRHRVRVELAGHQVLERVVEVVPGRASALTIALQATRPPLARRQ